MVHAACEMTEGGSDHSLDPIHLVPLLPRESLQADSPRYCYRCTREGLHATGTVLGH